MRLVNRKGIDDSKWEQGAAPRKAARPAEAVVDPALLSRAVATGLRVQPARVMALQRAAGNHAVVDTVTSGPRAGSTAVGRSPLVVQRDDQPPGPATPATGGPVADAAGTTGAAPDPTGPTVPGGSGTMAAPPRTQGVQLGGGDESSVSPEAQLSSDGNTVTLAVVAHNFNARSGRVLDILHEPGISIQVTPGNAPQPVIQAAIAALNAHIQSHGNDLVEISVSPQVQAGPGGVSASVQAQAEVHITATFSMTVSSTLSAAGHGASPDPSQVRVGGGGGVDLLWQPISIGTLFHLDSGGPERDRGPQIDVDALRADAKVINWVAGQLSAADFTSRAAGELDYRTMVTQLLDVMRGASGDTAEWIMHGMPPAAQLPAGLSAGLRRAAQLLAQASPELAHVHLVRVSVMAFDAQGSEHVVRWIPLGL